MPIDYSGFPSPKPIRKPKERKPLRRNTPLRASRSRLRPKTFMSRAGYTEAFDSADFRIGNLVAVYGPTPVCFQTARPSTLDQPIDRHHILGRGRKGQRDLMSSTFNCAMIRRDIHTGPLRDAPDQRRVYLRVACQHVMNAAGQGKYSLNDIDRAFILFVRRGHPEYADIYEGIPID